MAPGAAGRSSEGDLQEARLKEGMRPDAPGFGEDPDPGWFYGGSGVEPRPLPTPGANQREYYSGRS